LHIKDYTDGKVIGRHFSCLYTPEERSAGRPTKSLETVQREGKYESEGWHVRGDGSRFFASVVIDAIRCDDGEILGFAKITRDITNGAQRRRPLRESEGHFRLRVNGVRTMRSTCSTPMASSRVGCRSRAIRRYTADEIEDRFGGNAA
jgi:PAS domain S-box-containing protein